MAYIDVSGLPGITVLAGVDPITRDMFFSANTVDATVSPIQVYREMRIIRRLNESLRPYDPFLTALGKDDKGGGKFTERYIRQNLGTRFVPFDISHQLTIDGVLITDDGQEGVACFDRSPLTATTVVDINYIPPQVEVIEVNTGSGVSPQDVIDITNSVVNAIYSRVIENGETFEQALRLIRGEAAGDIVVTGNEHRIKSADGLIDRIIANADQNGRTVTATDGS